MANKDIMQQVFEDFNLEGYDLNRAIEREFLVDTITWTTAQGTGALLATLKFPKLLFDQPFIAEKIKDFAYFRGGVRLSVRISANKFLYGKILVTYNPIPSTDRFRTLNEQVFKASGFPHVIVSASASEAAVFDVPFISDRRVLNLSSWDDAEIGEFKVLVMNPLTTVAEQDSAKIMITAQFVESVLYLPHDRDVVETESNPKAEALTKSKLGVTSGIFSASKPLMGGLRTIAKSARPYTKALSAAAATAAVSSMFGLDKPTTMQTTAVTKINPYQHFAAGRGIDTVPKGAMDPECAIATQPIVGGISDDEMNLQYVIGTPQMVDQVSFVHDSPAKQLVEIGPEQSHRSFVDVVAANFKFWSGSYKVKIYITASLFHAVRGVFWLAEKESPVTSSWANCYHKVVDIQGDSEVEFMIPYLMPRGMTATSGESIFTLYFQVLTWSQPDSGLVCPIWLNVYKAGGPDYSVAAQKELFFQTESNPRADFLKDFEPLHPSMKGYKSERLNTGEVYESVRDIIHRVEPYGSYTGTGLTVYSTANGTNPIWVFQHVEMWGLLYRFYRGSMRLHLLSKSTTPEVAVCYIQHNGENLVGMNLTSPTNPVLELEVPWYSRAFFWSTTSQSSQPVTLQVDNRARYIMKSAGDDFSFHFLRPLPYGNFIAPSTTGLPGLRAFLSS